MIMLTETAVAYLLVGNYLTIISLGSATVETESWASGFCHYFEK